MAVHGIVEPVVKVDAAAARDTLGEIAKQAASGVATGVAAGTAVGVAAAGVTAGVAAGTAAAGFGLAVVPSIAIGSTVGIATAAGAGAGAAAGGPFAPLTALVGAIIGAVAGTAVGIAQAYADTPDDAGRFLVEIGYLGYLKHVKVTTDVPFVDKILIRHVRMLDLATADDYGLAAVNAWLKLAGQTDGTQAQNPMPLRQYFDLMSDAFIQHELESIITGAPDVHVPGGGVTLDNGAPGGSKPVQRAILRALTPASVRRFIGYLQHPDRLATLGDAVLSPDQLAQLAQLPPALPGAVSPNVDRFAAWVDGIMAAIHDTGPNPVRTMGAAWAEVKSTTGQAVEGTEVAGLLTDSAGAVWRQLTPFGWSSGVWTRL